MKTFFGTIRAFSSPDHIFVFGSNTAGNHGGGAAYAAVKSFGAVMHQSRGIQGKSYAIPTVDENIDKRPIRDIQGDVNKFLEYVDNHPNQLFFLTPIGIGIAGFSVHEMAELFTEGINLPNLIFPKEFVEYLAPPWESITEVEP